MSECVFLNHLLKFQVTQPGSHSRLASQWPWPLCDPRLWTQTSSAVSAAPALTSLCEGPPSAQSFAGHQTGAACLEGPRPGEHIFDGTNLVLDSDPRGKTPSAVGLIPHPGAFLGEVVLGKEMGAQWPLQKPIFPIPHLIHWARSGGTICNV